MRFPGITTGFAKRAAALVGLVLIVGSSVPLTIYWSERSELAEWARKAERYEPEGGDRVSYRASGVKTPATVPADQVALSDDEPVVGIEVGDRHRAYHLRSMGDMARHVVNDLVDGKAVSVAYCNIFDCITAYGGEAAVEPLDLGVAGLDAGSLLLTVHGFTFYQKTSEFADPAPAGQPLPKFPYASYPSERTTWGRWKALHPDTDLYIYEPPPSAEVPAVQASGR